MSSEHVETATMPQIERIRVCAGLYELSKRISEQAQFEDTDGFKYVDARKCVDTRSIAHCAECDVAVLQKETAIRIQHRPDGRWCFAVRLRVRDAVYVAFASTEFLRDLAVALPGVAQLTNDESVRVDRTVYSRTTTVATLSLSSGQTRLDAFR